MDIFYVLIQVDLTGFPCLFWSIFSKELGFATLHFLLQLVGGSTSILCVVFFFYEWLLHFSRKIHLTFLRYHLWYQSFFYHYIFLWLRFLSASHFFDAVQEELALSILSGRLHLELGFIPPLRQKWKYKRTKPSNA